MATKSITYLKPCLIREPSFRTDKVLLYMELTGKSKNEFEKWFYSLVSPNRPMQSIEQFYKLIESMQYGVYVDFFDSVGIEVFIDSTFCVNIWKTGDRICGSQVRPEARTAAITKADETHNKII